MPPHTATDLQSLLQSKLNDVLTSAGFPTEGSDTKADHGGETEEAKGIGATRS